MSEPEQGATCIIVTYDMDPGYEAASIPVMAYKLSRALADLADATIIAHARDRDALRGWFPEGQVVFAGSARLLAPVPPHRALAVPDPLEHHLDVRAAGPRGVRRARVPQGTPARPTAAGGLRAAHQPGVVPRPEPAVAPRRAGVHGAAQRRHGVATRASATSRPRSAPGPSRGCSATCCTGSTAMRRGTPASSSPTTGAPRPSPTTPGTWPCRSRRTASTASSRPARTQGTRRGSSTSAGSPPSSPSTSLSGRWPGCHPRSR